MRNIRQIVLVALVLGSSAPAAELQFSATVDMNTVGLGQEFSLMVKVEGEDMASVPRPELPPLPDFTLLNSSQSSSTNIQIVNGAMKKQSSVNFIYILAAKRLGKLTIGPCTLKYQGQEYRSQPIEIEVVKAAQQAGPGPQGQAPDMAPPAGQAKLEGNLFLAASTDRKAVYVGEQVNVEYTLYNRLQLSGVNMAQAPSFTGFWPEKLYDADKLNFQRRTVDSKQYNAALLKKVALFPMSGGELTIGPMALNVGVVQPPQDFFDFFGSAKTAKIQSNSVAITVKPLPEEGRPAEFTGAVGQFTIAASLDKTAATGNEPLNLTVTVTGTGNVRLVEKPAVPAIPGLKVLDPEIKENVRISSGVVKGSKTFTFPIIPQRDGKYAIPQIKMAFFDPKSGAYRTVQTAGYECTTTGCSQAAPLVEATGLKVLGTDITYIKPDARTLAAVPTAGPRWLFGLYLASLALLAASFWYRSHQERLLSDRGYARKLQATGAVRRRLSEAERLLRKKDENKFHSALSTAILGYIGDRFNLDVGALTKEQIMTRLVESGASAQAADTLMDLVEQCEVARFSPGRPGPARQELLARAREGLAKL